MQLFLTHGEKIAPVISDHGTSSSSRTEGKKNKIRHLRI
jgi:hypothetical protein